MEGFFETTGTVTSTNKRGAIFVKKEARVRYFYDEKEYLNSMPYKGEDLEVGQAVRILVNEKNPHEITMKE